MALQWGRNLIVAEGRAVGPADAVDFVASMGPQLDSCGRILMNAFMLGETIASMGPQLDSCGRTIVPVIHKPSMSFNGAAT